MTLDTNGLHIQRLHKSLRSGDNHFELSVPNLSITAGEIVGLFGKSGSGKSTLLDIIALVSKPDDISKMSLMYKGTKLDLKALVQSGDDDEISKTRSLHLGYILQHGGLLGYLTVQKNIELPFYLSKRKVDAELIYNLAKSVGIHDQLQKYPAALSGGQRQRVSVLRAIATKPSIILCDEPTASVDEHTARKILQELTTIAKEYQSAVLLVSHDMELIKTFTDRTYFANAEEIQGKICSTIAEVKLEQN